MKITPWMVCVLCIMLLTACGPDEKQLAEAWTVCGASAGSPTGKPVTGTVYEVDSINSGAPGVTLDGYDNAIVGSANGPVLTNQLIALETRLNGKIIEAHTDFDQVCVDKYHLKNK